MNLAIQCCDCQSQDDIQIGLTPLFCIDCSTNRFHNLYDVKEYKPLRPSEQIEVNGRVVPLNL